jgi:hypothetical protein
VLLVSEILSDNAMRPSSINVSVLTRLMAGEEDGLFMQRFSGVASSKWEGLLWKFGESPLLKSKEALPIESPLRLRGRACFLRGPDPAGPGLAPLALAELAALHLSSAEWRSSGSRVVSDIGLD